MNIEQIEKDILNILKSYLNPEDVTRFVTDMKDAEAFERGVLGTSVLQGAEPCLTASLVGERLDHMITFLQGMVSERDAYDALLEIANTFKKRGTLQHAEEIFTLVLTHGLKSKERGCVGEAYMGRGEVYCLQGRWKDSVADLNKSREIFAKIKDHALVGRVENIVGTGYAEQGNLREARKHFHRALTMFENLQERQMVGMVLMNLGIVQNIMGQYDGALAEYHRAKPYFEAAGDLGRLAELHHNIGMSYTLKSTFDKAFREFDTSIALSTRIGNRNVLGLATLGKAAVLYRMQDYPMALKLIAQATEWFKTSNERMSLAETYKLRGMIHRELGKTRYADVYLRTSLRMNQELGNRLNIAETSLEIGNLETSRGRNKEATRAYVEAIQHFKAVGASRDAARVESTMNLLKRKRQ